jgi:DNA-binding transcriptional LysR family regulator
MRFDVADLQLFLSVVEAGSLTRGAQALRLSLPSASERIGAMEDELGAQLLERTSRGVRTTSAGDALVPHARVILFQVEQMRGALGAFGRGLKGRVRLLTNTAAMMGYLPPRLRAFLLAHPDLSIDLEERPSVEIALAVTDGRADLGVAADVADLSALQTEVLATDRLMALLPAGHRLAGGEALAFSEAASEPFVGTADAALEVHLAERATRLGLRLDYRVRLRRVADVADMVAAGVGIAIVAEASASGLRRDGLAIVPLEDRWAQRQLHLCARNFRALTPPARHLADHLLAP